MGTILQAFVVVFFAISAISLGVSIFRGQDAELSKSCRRASFMAFIIGLILLYLHFVFG